MIATIAKRFTFDAAHLIPTCPEDHPCRRLHGHTYTVEITLCGPVKPGGFVVDYDQIAKAWEPLARRLDHKYLNDVAGLETPSTEILAAWIARELVDGESGDLVCGVPAPPLPQDSSKPSNLGAYRPTTLVTQIRVEESSSTWCVVKVKDADCKRSVWALLEGHVS